MSLDGHRARLRARPLLSAHDERALATAIAQGDRSAYERLVCSNIRLVLHLAARSAWRTSSPMDDLIQEGLTGLLRAARTFSPHRGVRFSTYATQCIRRAIARFIDSSDLIRLPVGTRHHALLLRSQISPQGGVGTSRSRTITVAALRALSGPLSLDVASDGADSPLSEILPSTDPLPEEVVWTRWVGEVISRAITRLPRQQREVLESLYGLRGQRESEREIARRLGVSRQRVDQIKARALHRLRRMPEVAALAPGEPGQDPSPIDASVQYLPPHRTPGLRTGSDTLQR